MKQFSKDHWLNIVLLCACIVLVVLMMPLMKTHSVQHQELAALDGWSYRQVIVAPNLPCTNCKNTIFQLHHVDDNSKVTAVCCLCGVSHVEIDCHNNDSLVGLAEIFKHDSSKFQLNLIDGGYVPGHIYYDHRMKP